MYVWIYAISILAISILGLHAGHKENGLLLEIFAGLMMALLVANLLWGFIAMVCASKSLLGDSRMQEELIWRQREMCGTFYSANSMFKTAMGVYFGTAAIFMLDFIMALFMIKQVKHPDVTAPVLVESAEPLPSSSGTCCSK
ncbi:uncharacterized protein ACB058_000939 isoform 2-T2 [Synchiropus picturatus]